MSAGGLGRRLLVLELLVVDVVMEEAGVVFSMGSNARLRNQARPDGDHHVYFDNSQLQDEVVDGVVQGLVSEMHGDGSVLVTGRVSHNQGFQSELRCDKGDRISTAIMMVNAGNRVSARIQKRVDDPQRMVATAGTENPLIKGVDPLLHVRTSSGVGMNFSSKLLPGSEPVTQMDHQVVSAVDGVAKAVLERSHFDIGKFLGFSSMETGVSLVGNKPGDKTMPTVTQLAPAGMSRHARNHGRWLAREKGKSLSASGDGLTPNVNRSNPGPQSAMQGQRGHTGRRSFAAVLSGLLDLNSLPKPLNEGGIIRVVIP
ncbi:hypothetical protein NE237_010014 [Protea cynaroides]|uniref:Uncharacterized protein n=1 Tax=Protea cynaroides TaxID=273540 RepID=A0A9Q0KYZ1_9MAGN|nr:hypothetical protein NE237_010014 [Protea cynaroides]